MRDVTTQHGDAIFVVIDCAGQLWNKSVFCSRVTEIDAVNPRTFSGQGKRRTSMHIAVMLECLFSI